MMKSALALLLVFLLALVSTRAEGVVNEKELYYGDCLEGDMVEDPIMKYTSGTCSYYCKNLDRCMAWTFVDDFNQCKTFSAVRGTYPDSLCISGILAATGSTSSLSA